MAKSLKELQNENKAITKQDHCIIGRKKHI